MIVSRGFGKDGFDAYGGTVLKIEDMAYWLDRDERVDPAGVTLGLDEGIEEVEPGFFDLLPTINDVWIENPGCKIHMTDKTIKLFQANHVILRGVYDSVAEELARKHRLRFLHLDVKLASAGDYFDHGSDTITLRFRKDGTVYIHQDARCQGISAGSIGGAENSFDIPHDFYLKMTAEQVADMCWGSCYREMIENGRLASLMAKAREKNGFIFDFTKG